MAGRLNCADCVEEVGGPTVWDVARNQARVSLFALRPALGRAAGQLCHLSEVLDGGSEEELVLSTKRASQPKAIEAQDALQVREQHFDLLPFTARPDIGVGLRDVARDVSGLFVD